MVDVDEVAENIYMIDDQLYSIPKSGSVYFLNEAKKVLVDAGPATSAKVVLDGIRQVGFGPEEVDYIIITHIHLDHGGGVGTLLRDMPQTQVVVHHRAAKHLVNPARLISSVIEAQGEEAMVRNGEVVPVEEHRVKSVYDGDTIELSSKQVLMIMETPGHAPHELCIYENRNGGVFVGDAVGHHVAGTDIMVPITPPPSFDLELYIETLKRLMKLNATRIYFAHFGVSTRVQEKLELAVNKLKARNDIIDRAMQENDLDNAAARVVAHVCAELKSVKREMRSVYDYWVGVDVPMSASEHVRYYTRKHGI
jgi:glyoxylase-like metal-dependent hydrolase (beta-lactamase superfamily II)